MALVRVFQRFATLDAASNGRAEVVLGRGGPSGSLYLGSPETVARKIASTAKSLGLVRFDMKYSAGQLPHDRLMHSIGLYGAKVIPLVRDMLAST